VCDEDAERLRAERKAKRRTRYLANRERDLLRAKDLPRGRQGTTEGLPKGPLSGEPGEDRGSNQGLLCGEPGGDPGLPGSLSRGESGKAEGPPKGLLCGEPGKAAGHQT
jgi:hypothetical protein